MTGNGTKTSPYRPVTWTEFLSVCNLSMNTYVKFADEAEDIDFQFDLMLSPITIQGSIDFNGITLRNLYVRASSLFLYSFGDYSLSNLSDLPHAFCNLNVKNFRLENGFCLVNFRGVEDIQHRIIMAYMHNNVFVGKMQPKILTSHYGITNNNAKINVYAYNNIYDIKIDKEETTTYRFKIIVEDETNPVTFQTNNILNIYTNENISCNGFTLNTRNTYISGNITSAQSYISLSDGRYNFCNFESDKEVYYEVNFAPNILNTDKAKQKADSTAWLYLATNLKLTQKDWIEDITRKENTPYYWRFPVEVV